MPGEARERDRDPDQRRSPRRCSRRTKRSRVAPSRESPASPATSRAPGRGTRGRAAWRPRTRSAIETRRADPGASIRRRAMAREPTPSAILLDALGTLLGVRAAGAAPARRAARAHGHRHRRGGREAAIRAEIAYYRAHLHEGRDAAALHDLRAALRGGDGPRPARRRDASSTRCWPSLRFYAYPDSAPALRALRERGHPARRRLQLGLVAARAPARDRARARSSTARSPPPRSARPSPTARSSRAALRLAGTTPDADLARRRHARGRRRGRPRGRHPPGPDRARRRRAGRRRRGPIAGRAHTLARDLIDTIPEIPRRRRRRRSPAPPARSRCGRRSRRCSPRCSSSA